MSDSSVTRPTGVPSGAVWNEADAEWELGSRSDGKRIGDWVWWRGDGTKVCESSFNLEGNLQGSCRRYHPNGEVSYQAEYRDGTKYGIETIARTTEGQSTEVGALTLPEIHPDLKRMDCLYFNDELAAGTLYNHEGLVNPIAIDKDGVATGLGEQVSKLLPGTSFSLRTSFLQTQGSAPRSTVDAMLRGKAEPSTPLILPPKLPKSMLSKASYICPAVKGGTIHSVEIVDHQGGTHMAIVSENEISRSLTLAVDYLWHLKRKENS